jgi:hypothetical protein
MLAGGILDQATFVCMNGRTLRKLESRAPTQNDMARNADVLDMKKGSYANMVEDNPLVQYSTHGCRTYKLEVVMGMAVGERRGWLYITLNLNESWRSWRCKNPFSDGSFTAIYCNLLLSVKICHH